MEFELSEEHRLLRKTARKFAEEVIRPAAEECDEHAKYPHEIIEEAKKLDFIAPAIPQQYGGAGMDFLAQAIVIEELTRGDPGIAQAVTARIFGCDMLLEFGTEEQKKKFLVPVAKGDWVMGSAITEPEAGSDVASIKTRAEKKGNEYVINGTKTFITNGSVADFLIIFARTDFNPPEKHMGITAFIVEKDRQGYIAEPLKKKMGIRASDLAEITLKDVQVPEENIIGQLSMGFYHLMQFFSRGRTAVAAQAVGIAQGAFDEAFKYAQERQAFGRHIVDFQAIQFKLADMATDIEAARLLTYRAAWQISRGGNPAREASMAKLFASRVAREVANEALQIHGGYGFIKEYAVERFYRDAKITELYEGTSEIQRIIIARSLLGKI
ncbi:MAG: acyl-CoA dehydrogenase [Candidatus Fraserbacteria bacterium RBG_16_55_9]|uniref:Acyl-CoA dehydrogenase n=1 Tax=Fraserbacteria sp. (strain RBG_16_55_9) TaxID=1817864 RepID=A0A1F5URB6_FRAXR|nr:MAG: acyl-CoA dehydrogenase [Candidatus Fraserbacteria bacterium RBG_16_55_9]